MPPSFLLNFRNNGKICVLKNIVDHYVDFAFNSLTCMAFFFYGKISNVIKETFTNGQESRVKTTLQYVRTYPCCHMNLNMVQR
jgi:hypothetical protein